MVLDDGAELRALGDRHADAFHHHVDDAIAPVRGAHQPVELQGRAPGPAEEALDHDHALAVGPGLDHVERLARVALEARGVGGDNELLEQAPVLLELLRRGLTPVAAEHEPADGLDVEALEEKPAKLGLPLLGLERRVLHHGDGLVAQPLDEAGRVGGIA